MDFTAPSFSLGFDLDDDEPTPPVGTERREQPRGYAAPDAPSFSLGIDFDDNVDEDPRLPAVGRREEQALGFHDDDDVEEEPRNPRAAVARREERARGSAAPDLPTFSLGVDDDDDCGIFVAGQRHEEARPQVAPRAPTPAGAEDEDDDFDLDGSKQPPPGTNRFKRLRKGPTPTPQVRRCELPDDEFIADGQHQKQPRSPAAPRAPASFSFEDEGDFFQRPELAQREMTPLKLLRKSPAPPHLAPTPPPLKVPGYMHYFVHDDPRVRDLVSSRLQHFIPTGAGSTRDNEQSRGGSLSCRRQLHSSAAANDEWVTPRIPVPTDVGKRRVHARENQSGSGHWFTNDSGKRVYVSRNGWELTGRDAYRQYQKESGRGFNSYKKKGSSGAKSETRAKQSSSGTKRGAKVKIETAAKRKR